MREMLMEEGRVESSSGGGKKHEKGSERHKLPALLSPGEAT
jgi:hypothetical protein